MIATQSTELANGTRVVTRTSVDAPGCTCFIRESRDADLVTAKGAVRASLTVEYADGLQSFFVRWAWSSGRTWSKGHRKAGFKTEAEARDFADRKWSELLAWLPTCEALTPIPMSAYLGSGS